MEQATFGAGCFWGVEAAFGKVPGVVETSVGYCGGQLSNPTYEQVCTGTTGHAEVVRVVFDPDQVTYEQLLDLFWDSPRCRYYASPCVGLNNGGAVESFSCH